jgi:hypothetical protein
MLCYRPFQLPRQHHFFASFHYQPLYYSRKQLHSVVQMTQPMEVEVKIRLLTKTDYDKLKQILGVTAERVEEQENHFLDGPNKEL